MDNNGEAFATVLVLAVDGYNQTVSNINQTLRVGSDLDKMGMVLIIDGTRVNDVRVYEDGIMPTVISRYGTGGGNVPMVFEPKSAFEENWAESEVKNALRANASKSSHAVVYPIDDARELEKHQNGTGIGAEGAPAYTLDRQQAPAVVEVIGPLTASGMSRARGTETVESHHYVQNESVVRRLTPVECERLQGFPDGWTDGQADSNRYKQMGNAVAVPVVSWIINRMVGASK
jgi:DNA (cytosine-5)-methyltransferase 1